MVKYIVQENQAKVASLDKMGNTPLMVAAMSGKVDVFNYILYHSKKLTNKNKNNDNILHLAVVGGSVRIVKRVLSRHVVSIESKEQYGRTPLLLAARHGHREVMELLVDEGCNVTDASNSRESKEQNMRRLLFIKRTRDNYSIRILTS